MRTLVTLVARVLAIGVTLFPSLAQVGSASSGLVAIIVIGLLIDSLRLLGRSGWAGGIASLSVALGPAVALGLAVDLALWVAPW